MPAPGMLTDRDVLQDRWKASGVPMRYQCSALGLPNVSARLLGPLPQPPWVFKLGFCLGHSCPHVMQSSSSGLFGRWRASHSFAVKGGQWLVTWHFSQDYLSNCQVCPKASAMFGMGCFEFDVHWFIFCVLAHRLSLCFMFDFMVGP